MSWNTSGEVENWGETMGSTRGEREGRKGGEDMCGCVVVWCLFWCGGGESTGRLDVLVAVVDGEFSLERPGGPGRRATVDCRQWKEQCGDWLAERGGSRAAGKPRCPLNAR